MEKDKSSKPKKIAKKSLVVTGKALAYLSGGDVAYKNAKRIKPRYPEMWKQIFSKEGFNKLLKRQKVRKVKKRDVLSLFATMLLSALVVLYSLAMIFQHPHPEVIPLSSRVLLFAFLVLGLALSMIYLFTCFMLIKKLAGGSGK